MARIRVKNLQTGKTGTLPEEQVQQAVATGMYQLEGQSKSLMENIGSGVLNFGKALAQPYIRSGKRVFGLGEEVGRKGDVDKAEKLLAEAQKRILSGDTSPEVKAMLDEAENLSRTASRETLAQKDKSLTDPLQMAKDLVASASWRVPASGLLGMGKVGTSAVAGGMGGFGYSPETSAEGLLGSTALGAVTGGVLGKIGAVREAKMARGEPSGLAKAGLEAKRGVVRPQVGGGPEAILKEDELITSLKNKGITGTPTKMRYGVAREYKKLYNQVGNILDTPGATRNSYDVNTVKNAIRQSVESNGSFYAPGDKSFTKLLDRELSLLDKKAIDGYVSDKAIYEAIGSLNNQLSSAFNKVSGKSSSSVTQVEGVRLDTRQALTDLLGVSRPELQPITKEMSILHTAETGLKSASMESVNLLGLPIPGLGQAFMGAQNKLGDLLIGLGGGVGKATPKAVSSIAPSTVNAIPAVGALIGQTRQPSTTQVSPTIPAGGMQTGQEEAPTDILSMLGLDEQSLTVLASLPTKTSNAILEDLISKKVLEGGAASPAEQERENVKDNIQMAVQLLNTGTIKTGAIGGRVENVKSKLYSGGDPTTVRFNIIISNLRAAIAKARGGTSFTANEQALLNTYSPQVGDSVQQLQEKLTRLSELNY